MNVQMYLVAQNAHGPYFTPPQICHLNYPDIWLAIGLVSYLNVGFKKGSSILTFSTVSALSILIVGFEGESNWHKMICLFFTLDELNLPLQLLHPNLFIFLWIAFIWILSVNSNLNVLLQTSHSNGFLSSWTNFRWRILFQGECFPCESCTQISSEMFYHNFGKPWRHLFHWLLSFA